MSKPEFTTLNATTRAKGWEEIADTEERVQLLPELKRIPLSGLVHNYPDRYEFHPEGGQHVFFVLKKQAATPAQIAIVAQTLAIKSWGSKAMIAKFIGVALRNLADDPTPTIPQFDLARILR